MENWMKWRCFLDLSNNLPFTFSVYTFLYVSHCFLTNSMTHLSHPSWLGDPTHIILWLVQFYTVFKQFSSASSHFLTSRRKRFPLSIQKRDQYISHKNGSKIKVLYVLIFTYTDNTVEDKRFLTARQKPFPEFSFKMGCVKGNCPGCHRNTLSHLLIYAGPRERLVVRDSMLSAPRSKCERNYW
jgi:hypothetical protein